MKPSKNRAFAILYFGTLGTILLVLLFGLVQGLVNERSDSSPWLYVFLYAVFIATPLSVIFAGMNVWGMIVYKGKRLLYVVIFLMLSAWCYFGFSSWNTPLP